MAIHSEEGKCTITNVDLPKYERVYRGYLRCTGATWSKKSYKCHCEPFG
ncbi:MAG: hypothetical protein HUJ51_03595 [Eggerthellaceae bacterium]|nr:hypothetical protein [Eggerthellaceae bacterium]